MVRARRVAWAYRQALVDAGVDTRDMDATFTRLGEKWVVPGPRPEPGALITADAAGELIGVSGATITKSRQRGRLTGYPDGRRYQYRVSDVYRLAVEIRRRGVVDGGNLDR